MALWQYADATGVHNAFAAVLASAAASALYTTVPLGVPPGFYSYYGLAFTRLAFDGQEDAILVTHDSVQAPGTAVAHWYINTQYSTIVTEGIGSPFRTREITLVLNPNTLSPAASGGIGSVSAKGFSMYYMPGQGGTTGLTYDPNTGTMYQAYWHYITGTPRGGGTLPYGYGTARMLSTTTNTSINSFWVYIQWDGVVNGTQTVPNVYTNSVGKGGWLWFAPGNYWFPLPPVVFNDAAVTAYADRAGYGWIGCWTLPATAANSWRGSHSMELGWPMSLSPYGADRCIAIWWAYPEYGAPLVYTIHRYDRALGQIRVEDIGTVPTTRKYGYPQHVGFATYDLRRGHFVMLSENPNTLDQFTIQNYCHPGVPLSGTPPTPLMPTHAGLPQRYAMATLTGGTIIGAQRITISHVGFAASNLSRKVTQTGTTGVLGQGTYTISWSSAASGQSGAFTLAFSTFSVAVSATYTAGNAYGTTNMAFLTSTASFTVSSTLLPPTGTTTTAVTLLPRIPVSQADMIGAGSPRLLSYPTSALATPYIYGINPPVWTNMLDQPYTRPLYAATRTLTQTANAQYVGHMTDLEVHEIWPGGNNRIAMALSQFAALYEMYMNPPDLASAGFITWEPRDITARKYKVLMTSLTAGGQDVDFNTLAKTGDGWIMAEVKLTLRLIEEV